MAAEEKNYHLKLPLSPHNPHAWTPDIVLNRFNQMRKDMRRDRVSINGQVIHAANEDYYESVAGILAQSILASAHTITKEHELATLTEASALVHASAILASGARTFSGGDAYACVHALCPGEHAVLCPLSTSASPLEISVSICQSSQPSVSRNDDDIKGHRRTKSDGTRAPHSSKETRAHRFIASFTSSPQRSESFSRTVSSPLTSSLASSHHNYPTMLEIALDEFQTNSQPIFNKNQPPRIDIALRATTDYKICTTNPQDLPSDTWLLVRAVWSRTFSIFGESTNGAHSFIASEPYVDIAIADAAFVPASVINNDDAFSDLFTS
uniref:Uncharacterized protein n=1 Tax=Aureoumbra lagunensis TaxID=44058 RepID=A0A7S3JPM7_9STRA